ncbi:hypothetical protein [Devosia sp. DBB001]|nr:hypothetical protein [Devosia sp. DBB001]
MVTLVLVADTARQTVFINDGAARGFGEDRAVVFDVEDEDRAGAAAAAVADRHGDIERHLVFGARIGMVDRALELDDVVTAAFRGAAFGDGDADDFNATGAADEHVFTGGIPDDVEAARLEGTGRGAQDELQRVIVRIADRELALERRGIGGVVRAEIVEVAEGQAFIGHAAQQHAGAAEAGAAVDRAFRQVKGRDAAEEFGRRQQVAVADTGADACGVDPAEIAVRALGATGGAGCGLDAVFGEELGHGLGRDFNGTDEERQSLHGAAGDHDDRTVRLDEFEIGSVLPHLADVGSGRETRSFTLADFDDDALGRCRGVGLRYPNDFRCCSLDLGVIVELLSTRIESSGAQVFGSQVLRNDFTIGRTVELVIDSHDVPLGAESRINTRLITGFTSKPFSWKACFSRQI